MAKVGDILLAPEAGWVRYDDSDSKITYSGTGWSVSTVTGKYNGSSHVNQTVSGIMGFSFYGTGVRIIIDSANTGSSRYRIKIDGVDYGLFSGYFTTEKYQILGFEAINLIEANHNVVVTNEELNRYLNIDAIDIVEGGSLVVIKVPLYPLAIGSSLPTPNYGWRRYEETNANITYIGQTFSTGFNCKYVSIMNSTTFIRFNFRGRAIRLLGRRSTSRALMTIKIDGQIYPFSQYSSALVDCGLDFEILDLSDKEHYVEISGDGTGSYYLNAIDIDMTETISSFRIIYQRYLLKSNSSIYIPSNETPTLTQLIEPLTTLDFETYGVEDLSLVTNTVTNNLLQNPVLLINSTAVPQVNIVSIPKPQLILPLGDIVFKMLQNIENLQVISNPVDTQNIKIIFSIDSGLTWKTYNNIDLLFEDVDVGNLDVVREKGIDVETFNLIGLKWNDIITEGKIRFGYYIDIESETDIAGVDRLDTTINIIGRWKNTVQGVDYNYGYGNEKINVKLYKDGSYKINYM